MESAVRHFTLDLILVDEVKNERQKAARETLRTGRQVTTSSWLRDLVERKLFGKKDGQVRADAISFNYFASI